MVFISRNRVVSIYIDYIELKANQVKWFGETLAIQFTQIRENKSYKIVKFFIINVVKLKYDKYLDFTLIPRSILRESPLKFICVNLMSKVNWSVNFKLNTSAKS